VKVLIIAMLIILLSAPCFALRCINTGQIIDKGNTKYEVLKWCGEPKSKEIIGEKGTIKSKYGRSSSSSSYKSEILEVWILDASQNADHLDYKLLFRGDKLIELQHIR
jgi:hypothetical protein